jgi:hypothetical protein
VDVPLELAGDTDVARAVDLAGDVDVRASRGAVFRLVAGAMSAT